MKLLTKDDFVHMSWEQYQSYVTALYEKLKAFLDENNISIDYIVPVLRGGAVLGISLSYLLRVVPLGTLQLKHDYKSSKIEVVSSFLKYIPKSARVILLVDGYHASGRTSYMAYDMIKKELPDAKIIYVTLGRDVGYVENKRDFLFSCSAFYSNECGVIPKEQSEREGVLTKYTLFPWEVLEDEIENMNAEIIYGG